MILGLLLATDLLVMVGLCIYFWPAGSPEPPPSPPAAPPAKVGVVPVAPPAPAAAVPAAPPANFPAQKASAADAPVEGAPNLMVAMAADHLGRLWIGTEEGGLWRYNPQLNPDSAWLQFTTKEGLGDNYVYAIAIDQRERIWVGHRSRGVSVYDGRRWENYPAPEGPLGGRVFALAVCPTDGDVWMATDAGLSRYFSKSDTWAHYTRAEGLPAEQANTLAFDAKGNLFVGTQCEGILIAEAAEGYKTWRQVTGPEAPPRAPSGAGLPGSQVNQILVARDGTVYAAMTRGLARSGDSGKSWSFVRGYNWVALVDGRYEPPPADWKPQAGAVLREDWTTCLAEDEAGMLWLGNRCSGLQRFDPKSNQTDRTNESTFVGGGTTAIVCLPGGPTYYANYMAPLIRSGTIYQAATGKRQVVLVNVEPPAFPSRSRPPSVEELLAAHQRVRALKPEAAAAFLGEDWETLGDWVGRYGRQFANFSGSSLNLASLGEAGYAVSYHLDPRDPGSTIQWRNFADKLRPNDRRNYLNPFTRQRMLCEQNAHTISASFPMEWEGPELWVALTVPSGPHRLSVYVNNMYSEELNQSYRDFLLELKRDVAASAAPVAQPAVIYRGGNIGRPPSPALSAQLDASPTLARTRLCNIRGGVTKQFIVNAAGKWWIKVNRNHSSNAKVMAVFIDRLPAVGGKLPPGITYAPPPAVAVAALSNPPTLTQAAQQLWAALDAAYTAPASASLQRPYRLLAYRAAASREGNQALLANWRWQLGLWTDADRQAFDQAFARTTP